MLRAATLTLAAGLLGACNGGGDTDPNGGQDGLNSAERLGVPEKFHLVWNIDGGCTTDQGDPGVQVYWHTDDAVSVDNGDGTYTLTATETWYWFHGDNSLRDCKDVWTLEATGVDPELPPTECFDCEEGWEFTRTFESGDCEYVYHTLWAYPQEEPPPQDREYTGYLLFDTHNELNLEPNPDNQLGVRAMFIVPGVGISAQRGYSIAEQSFRTVDDPAEEGPPGAYEWVGSSCNATGG